MTTVGRFISVVFIYGAVCVAWLVLGGIMKVRSTSLAPDERSEVEGLWGGVHEQRAPTLVPITPAQTSPTTQPPVEQTSQPNRAGKAARTEPPAGIDPIRSDIVVDLALDQRLKGLRWFALYDVTFAGDWTFDVPEGAHELRVALPNAHAIYDDFQLSINGELSDVSPQNGSLVVPIDRADTEVVVALSYKSRGLDSWRYAANPGSGSLRDFKLAMTTNFTSVAFPESALSPSSRREEGAGTSLEWNFSNIITTRGVGMVMPQRIQPGELAAQLSFTAPISLFFFFLIVGILTKLEKLDVHPINYMFLAAAFFSFHLLLAYTVDTMPLAVAFILSSVVSVVMVTSYLRLAVNARFGFMKAGLAQLIYLVGFSAAHFMKGLTGLTVTVLSIATLFVLMMLTGRIKWSEVLARPAPKPHDGGPYRTPEYARAPNES